MNASVIRTDPENCKEYRPLFRKRYKRLFISQQPPYAHNTKVSPLKSVIVAHNQLQWGALFCQVMVPSHLHLSLVLGIAGVNPSSVLHSQVSPLQRTKLELVVTEPQW